MRKSLSKVLGVAMVMTILLPSTPEALSRNFYRRSCPEAESLIRGVVEAAFASDPGIAAGLIRMHFHDCFVRGCDASVLLDGDDAEKKGLPNLSLRGFEVIDDAKAAVEAACPGVVSCADVLTFASRDSTELAGKFSWRVFAGRRDGSVSNDNETTEELPRASFNGAQLIDSFAAKGLTPREMVALSGAHSIGRAGCDSFRGRFSDDNPDLSSAYASLLRDRCPSTGGEGNNAMLDIFTPNTLDNKYYFGVENKLGLLQSDAALVKDASLAGFVRADASNERGWKNRFAKAMERMANIDVLEGSEGEVRTNCRVVNSQSSTVLSSGLGGGGDGEGRAMQ